MRALNRAYQQRSFEIDLYWRRGAYFWTFQAAILVALGVSTKETVSGGASWDNPLTVALAGLGMLAAFACALVARGSKFWQQNWERHVDMLEDEIEGRLYKTIWLERENVSFSVSGVNVALSECFVVFWLLVFAYAVCKFLKLFSWQSSQLFTHPTHWFWAIMIVVLIALGGWWCWRRTDIRGAIPDQNGNVGRLRWSPPCWCARRRKAERYEIVRRYMPAEDIEES